MRRRRLQVRRGSEDGAVLIIVTLLLVAMMGMLVLVVDVGGLLYRRVAMQNAADAAALAAALSCGSNQGHAEATRSAKLLAAQNSDGAVVSPGYPKFSPNCESTSGTVTVRVRVEQLLFFGPVLGSGNTTPVSTEATAKWGGAGATGEIAPLMLSSNRLTDCKIPPPAGEPVVPTTCTFYWDNSPANPNNPDPALTNAEWGTLDLINWDVPWDRQCNNSTPPEFSTWMFQGFPGQLNIEPPPNPTYVCRGQGNFGNSFDTLLQEAIDQQLLLYFPVNDPLKQIARDGSICSPGMSCSVDKYDILGFAKLAITDLWSGKSSTSYKGVSPNACATRLGITPTANSRCIVAEWTDYTNEGLVPAGGQNFGLVPVSLVG